MMRNTNPALKGWAIVKQMQNLTAVPIANTIRLPKTSEPLKGFSSGQRFFMQTSKLASKWLPRFLGIAALLVCFPLTARADAGTPLMWATMAHLVIGNLFIGIFEGLVLGWVFKLRIGLCILVMIPANYFSAWVGGYFLNDRICGLLPFTLYSAWHWLWAMVVVTFLLTLMLEWPFVWFCFRKEPGRFKKSWLGNVLVNALSYAALFSWYWLASGTTLYTKMNIVQPSEMSFPKAGQVYFLAGTNGAVSRLDLSSHRVEMVATLKDAAADDRLFIKPSAMDSNHWDIMDLSKKSVVCSNLQVTAAQSERDMDNLRGPQDTWFNFGNAVQLAAAEDSDWKFETGFWPIEGFRGTSQKTGEKIYFALETPFVAWTMRSATQLPGDYVVFQMGDDQICLLEAATKKITLLTMGHGPVVVIPSETKNR
jgi:hypothetical protein